MCVHLRVPSMCGLSKYTDLVRACVNECVLSKSKSVHAEDYLVAHAYYISLACLMCAAHFRRKC